MVFSLPLLLEFSTVVFFAQRVAPARITEWNQANVVTEEAPRVLGEVYNSFVYDSEETSSLTATTYGGIVWGESDVQAPGLNVVSDGSSDESCIMTAGFDPENPAEPKQCDDRFQTSKRFKRVSRDAMGSVDLVFDVDASSAVDDVYRIFEKFENLTPGRIKGFKIKLGTGIGSNFTPLSPGDGIYFTDRNGIAITDEDASLRDLDLGAFFAFGLFGNASTSRNHDLNGYYDPSTRGTLHLASYSDVEIEFSGISENFASLYGGHVQSWISKAQVPFAFFYDPSGVCEPLLGACVSNEECCSGLCTGREGKPTKCRFCARKKETCDSTADCCQSEAGRYCHPDLKKCLKCPAWGCPTTALPSSQPSQSQTESTEPLLVGDWNGSHWVTRLLCASPTFQDLLTSSMVNADECVDEIVAPLTPVSLSSETVNKWTQNEVFSVGGIEDFGNANVNYHIKVESTLVSSQFTLRITPAADEQADAEAGIPWLDLFPWESNIQLSSLQVVGTGPVEGGSSRQLSVVVNNNGPDPLISGEVFLRVINQDGTVGYRKTVPLPHSLIGNVVVDDFDWVVPYGQGTVTIEVSGKAEAALDIDLSDNTISIDVDVI